MKTFQLLALLCLIIYTYQTCDGASKENCKPDNLDDTEKKTAEYCCWSKDGDDSTGYCEPYSKYQYKHIKDIIKKTRLDGRSEDYSIDCKSLFLQISLLIKIE